ncbi:MAG: ATP-binding protein [Rhodopila sp.]
MQNAQGSRVLITGAAAPDEVVVSIDDDGPGIADGAMAVALTRGGRLDETRPGTGLGLAIVSDLVEVYGGILTLGRSALGGLQVTLRLPMRPIG